jgi:predicted DCC family thiol-disulfide oxidoreductase YuxK
VFRPAGVSRAAAVRFTVREKIRAGRLAAMIATAVKPERDTVIYDGQCRFCQGQIGMLRRLDLGRSLTFLSLHDADVSRNFPELSPDELMARMYVIDRRGVARGGAEAVRYLSRRLPVLWPLALPLHVPGSLPLWNRLYAWIARHRYTIAGTCDTHGSCRLP